MKTARDNNLVNATESSFVLRADSKTKLGRGGRGRMSNRIVSKTMYREHLSSKPSERQPFQSETYLSRVVIDVAHMPVGDATWFSHCSITSHIREMLIVLQPAFWMTRRPWPSQGELDIIEGVNDQGPNVMSLHTGPNCSMRHDPTKMKVRLSQYLLNRTACSHLPAGQASVHKLRLEGQRKSRMRHPRRLSP